MNALTLQPVAPWPMLLLLAVGGLLLVWWPRSRPVSGDGPVARGRRTAMVVLLLLAALRPGVPGVDVQVQPSAVDVYFVVDTTTSVMARDYEGSQPRMQGVRADIKAIADQLPGARFMLLTFDHETRTRLPLTNDALALQSAADTLTPETSVWSQGSSVTAAATELEQALARGREAHPERARVVFYLGDGEQTASGQPQPFQLQSGLLNGGAVLGYGTTAGGPMQRSGDQENGDVVDPSTGQPAISRIDEQELQTIAGQLDVPYRHRTQDDHAAGVVDAVRLRELDTVAASGTPDLVTGRAELYWVFLLLLALVAAWELGAALLDVTGRRRPRARVRPAQPGTATPGDGPGARWRGVRRARGAVPSNGAAGALPTEPIDPRDLTPTGGAAR